MKLIFFFFTLAIASNLNKNSSFLNCSPHYVIYNQSSNSINSIVVSSENGSITYNNPSFPLSFYNGGFQVTIIVHFVHSGPNGILRTYDVNSQSLVESEQYDPRYLVPIGFEGADINCTSNFSMTISNN